MKKYKIAVVGATGVVGRSFLKVLEERKLPAESYTLFASQRSAGSTVRFMDEDYTVQLLTEEAISAGFDIALFSAGGETSKHYAPIAAKSGCLVIDNSSCWRMDPNVPLVVPEVNPQDILKHKGIIANPNCSTIQAMVVLSPIQKKYGIKRVIYSTYQAVSGAGAAGINDLDEGAKAYAAGREIPAPKKFDYPIFCNCIPQIDVFDEDDYTKEELKMVNETRKILGVPDMAVTATCVRVPVFASHSESINLTLENPFEIEDIKALLASSEGVVLVDDVKNKKYPLAADAADKDEVFVGRVRIDRSCENSLNMWCVADNIRKGAATNAVQIAQKYIELMNK
ncbi:MAG: aspartate-semialdehyde dehydrogenase [Clostridia bacterium]|nr:aspartate-semialdehyde dehydrogenase [Clostridia bacterium]